MSEAIAAYLVSVGFTGVTASGVSSALFYAAVTAASYYNAHEQQRRAQNRARDQHNAALEDRYIMVRGATEPRQLVLGRQRVSGPMAFVGSYGTVREKLVFVLPLAAHEVDGIEEVYFDDEIVSLDSAGNVTGVTQKDVFSITTAGGTFTLRSAVQPDTATAVVEYGSTVLPVTVTVVGKVATVSGATAGQPGTLTISYQPDPCAYIPQKGVTTSVVLGLDASGNGSVTLPIRPIAGSVYILASAGGSTDPDLLDQNLTVYSTVSGFVVTVTGATLPGAGVPFTGPVVVQYDYLQPGVSRARVRKFLGAPGQAADAAMVAALPGVWTTAHTFTGIAGLVVELDYDPEAFPGGLPNVSAVVRGAKVYDPRTTATTWSENPALLLRHAALSPLCGRLPADAVDNASIITAANACDVPAAYVVGLQTFTRPLYTAGLTVRSGTRGHDALDSLAQAMAGRWVFVDGQLRVKAGAYMPAVLELDATWLVDGQPVQVQPRPNRADAVNIITGKFSDARHDYQVLDYPRVSAEAYIAEDGAELPLDLQLDAITFTGQAQQVAAATMRDARQGLRVSLLCNMRAYPLQVFDPVAVTLPRFGWEGKLFEVLDASWTLDGGIALTLKETDASIWALGNRFATADPAPNTMLRSPLDIDKVLNLTVASGAGIMLTQPDGTVLQRLRVSWDAMTDPAVLASGGGIEVLCGRAGSPPEEWVNVVCSGAQTEVFIPLVRFDGVYAVKARAFNRMAKGLWSGTVSHQVDGVNAAITTAGIAPGAATEVYGNTPSSAVTVTGVAHTPDGFNTTWNTEVCRVTFTPASSGTAQVYFEGRGNYTNSAGSVTYAAWSIQDSAGGGTYDPWKRLDRSIAASAVETFGLNTSRKITVTGGTAYTFAVFANKFRSGDTFTIDNMEMRVEVVKR